MLLLDSPLLRRTLRTGANLLSGALHVQALTLTELGELAESLADLLGGRERAQGRSQPVATSASAAEPSFREDGEGPGSATPAWPTPTGLEPADRASVQGRDVAGTTSATRVEPSGGDSISSAPVSRSPPRPATDREPTRSSATPPSGTAAQAGPTPAAPAHVDEEAILVAESADQGAEEGPGASIHVEEPWSGYRQMRAREIVDHLPAVADAVLTLVLLYEPKAGRKRSSVIQAAERELSRRST